MAHGDRDGLPSGRVTRLEAQKRNPGRVNVHLDGAYGFSADASVIASVGLRMGDVLDVLAVGRLLDEDERESAHGRALRYLETRERSTHEMRLRLARYGYEEQVIQRTLEWLAGLGYLDDTRYAVVYAREKSRGGWGPGRIAAELGRRGVPPAVTTAVLADMAAQDEAGGDDAATGNLAQLVRRRFGKDWARDPTGTRRRAYSFLARRGHDPERIGRILQSALCGADDQEDAPA
jgi:regulatory protein